MKVIHEFYCVIIKNQKHQRHSYGVISYLIYLGLTLFFLKSDNVIFPRTDILSDTVQIIEIHGWR